MAGKVKAMVFPVVMYGCDSWAIKKAERQRIDAFELWYWRRLLRVLWTARRSNQSILKEINPEYSLEGLMMKLKLQFFGHLMRRADSLEKTLMLGKIKGRKIRGQRRMRWHHWLNGHEFESSGRWWRTGKPAVRQRGRKELDTTKRLTTTTTKGSQSGRGRTRYMRNYPSEQKTDRQASKFRIQKEPLGH